MKSVEFLILISKDIAIKFYPMVESPRSLHLRKMSDDANNTRIALVNEDKVRVFRFFVNVKFKFTLLTFLSFLNICVFAV
jgi:hypothetical protein